MGKFDFIDYLKNKTDSMVYRCLDCDRIYSEYHILDLTITCSCDNYKHFKEEDNQSLIGLLEEGVIISPLPPLKVDDYAIYLSKKTRYVKEALGRTLKPKN